MIERVRVRYLQCRRSMHLNIAKALSPVLCGVINPHDFDGLLSNAIHSHVGSGRKQNLAGAFFAPGAATPWPFFQNADSPVQFPHGRVAVARMVFFEVIADALQIRCGGGRPAYAHLILVLSDGTGWLLAGPQERQTSRHVKFYPVDSAQTVPLTSVANRRGTMSATSAPGGRPFRLLQ